MKTPFFPNNKKFWLYHLTAIAVLDLGRSTITLSAYSGIYAKMYLIGWHIWIVLLSFAVLLFRYIYKNKNLRNQPIHKTIIFSILYGALSGFLVSGITQGIILPIFWQDAIAIHTDHTAVSIVILTIVGTGLESQLYICGWIFIYIGITTSRIASENKLHNLRLQNNLKEAQLSNLSNQLNPHFLFNSLNNIRFMIHENKKNADQMITSLSEILRYSLDISKNEKVPIEQEIEIINQYISIVKIQLENRLLFSMTIPEQYYKHLIPPMALQMLVENAIKHGLENIYEGGKLSVNCIEKNDKLIFVIENDVPTRIGLKVESTKIGLQNIKERLLLLYGDTADLCVSQNDNVFRVELLIPKEQA